jgi:ferredoxin-NADP reductase
LDARNATAYLCGHPEMLAHGKAILRRHGWEKDALKEESYFRPAPVTA